MLTTQLVRVTKENENERSREYLIFIHPLYLFYIIPICLASYPQELFKNYLPHPMVLIMIACCTKNQTVHYLSKNKFPTAAMYKSYGKMRKLRKHILRKHFGRMKYFF